MTLQQWDRHRKPGKQLLKGSFFYLGSRHLCQIKPEAAEFQSNTARSSQAKRDSGTGWTWSQGPGRSKEKLPDWAELKSASTQPESAPLHEATLFLLTHRPVDGSCVSPTNSCINTQICANSFSSVPPQRCTGQLTLPQFSLRGNAQAQKSYPCIIRSLNMEQASMGLNNLLKITKTNLQSRSRTQCLILNTLFCTISERSGEKPLQAISYKYPPSLSELETRNRLPVSLCITDMSQ